MPVSALDPLVLELPAVQPTAALAALHDLPYPFLLHSARPDERSQWSFFGADPFEVFRGGTFDRVHAAWQRGSTAAAGSRASGSAPFRGGMVGYWAYDLGRQFERLPAYATDDLGLPDLVLGGYDVVGAHEHRTGRTWLYSSGMPLVGAEGVRRAEERLEAFGERLMRARSPEPPAVNGMPITARSTFTPDGYRQAVDRIREHIRRGDIFQANLSQRWSVPTATADFEDVARSLFLALGHHSAAPFAAYFGAGDHAIVSASPERFLELRGPRVETRPIKGTRPRGRGPAEDAALAADLRASTKDHAENVMIVDVLRNDLGRVCETGSVVVPELCALESFPQVHHLTSTVTGRLRRDFDAFDLLRAAFPGGSITGAPKIRAMEILETIEPTRRHVYTGAIGYVDWSGDADWNIAIRTAWVTPRAIHFAAGGGITADSDPDAEWRESLDKAEGLRLALSAVLGPVLLEDGVPAR